MSFLSLTFPSLLSPSSAQKLASNVSQILAQTSRSSLPFPLSFLLGPRERFERWMELENTLLACLRTGDDSSAKLCLDALQSRFGEQNERVLILKGLCQEAAAKDHLELDVIAKAYGIVLHDEPANLFIRKRQTAIYKSLAQYSNAISTLVEYLSISPTDLEAWTELADLYEREQMYSQAIFCLQEVLLLSPNSWNIHAQLGNLHLRMVVEKKGIESIMDLIENLDLSIKRFCRSVELCDSYIRGLYGLVLSTRMLLPILMNESCANPSRIDNTRKQKIETLHKLGIKKLLLVVNSSESDHMDYDRDEIEEVRSLLKAE